MTAVSRHAWDQVYREKVDAKDRDDHGGVCPDCGGPVPGLICRPCWKSRYPEAEFFFPEPEPEAPF